jgi:hypothetical protein
VFGRRQAIALAGRFFMALGAEESLPIGVETWRDSDVILRAELGCSEYQDVFTHLSVKTEIRNGKAVLPLRDVFSHLPLALLVGDNAGEDCPTGLAQTYPVSRWQPGGVLGSSRIGVRNR